MRFWGEKNLHELPKREREKVESTLQEKGTRVSSQPALATKPGEGGLKPSVKSPMNPPIGERGKRNSTQGS